MSKKYICIKCGCENYESREVKINLNEFPKIFDEDNRYILISCINCGYTEIYKATTKSGLNIIDFFNSQE